MQGDENLRSIQQRDQSVFIRKAWGLTGFEYAGDKAALGGTVRSLGQTQYSAPTLPQRGAGWTFSAAAPQPSTGQLVLKKSIATVYKAEAWLKGRWDLDVRYQEGGQRGDPRNWEMIDRRMLARFSQYATSPETTLTAETNSEVMVALNFECAPRETTTLHRLTQGRAAAAPEEVLCLSKVSYSLDARASHAEAGYGVIAGTAATGGHPYFGRSSTGGQAWNWVCFDGLYNTPNWANAITGAAGVGQFFVVVSYGQGAHAYTTDGGQTWTEKTFARYASHAPRAVTMHQNNIAWICGDDGYVWVTQDGAHGQVVHAGTQVRTNLTRIYALGDRTLLSVGASNGILVLENQRWKGIKGPGGKAADQILCAAPILSRLWALGYDDGEIYWTEDQGDSWETDTYFNNLGWTVVNDLAPTHVARVIAGGKDGSGATLEDNVHEGPNWWDAWAPTVITEVNAIVACDENHLVVAGKSASGGALAVWAMA